MTEPMGVDEALRIALVEIDELAALDEVLKEGT